MFATFQDGHTPVGLNESPSQKEGKFHAQTLRGRLRKRLNESPSQKEGKWNQLSGAVFPLESASMKALPRRKGNSPPLAAHFGLPGGLNESPSQKEGKCEGVDTSGAWMTPQ